MKRYLVLIACLVIQSCLGVVYAWSTFVPALKQEYGIHEGHSGLIFGTCIATFTVIMVFGGILQQKYGPRKICAAGGLLFLTGYVTGSFSGGNFTVIFTGLGLLAGAGIGLGYVCPLATGIKWFPSHKGFITGLAVAGFGLGAVFFSKTGQHMLDQGHSVLTVFRNIGLIAGGIVILASTLLFLPDRTKQKPSGEQGDLPLRAILKQTEFKTLFWMIFCGTFGGLLIIGNLKPIGLSVGLPVAKATFSVMLFAVGNAAGRVLWGLLYDRIGSVVIIWCMLLLAVGAGWMTLFHDPGSFYISTVVIAFAFGGCFVLFAAQVAASFGAHRLGEIYPFVFLGYGIAALIGPATGGWLIHRSGSPALATGCVVLIAITGAVTAKIYPAGKNGNKPFIKE